MAEPIKINLEAGYWPHFVPLFFERYGVFSQFVRGVADCLTARHVNLLKRAGRIDQSTQPIQLGSAEAVGAIEALLRKMQSDGAAKPFLHILHESMGVKAPGVLEAEVDRLYGRDAFSRWLELFESQKYNQAAQVLETTHDR